MTTRDKRQQMNHFLPRWGYRLNSRYGYYAIDAEDGYVIATGLSFNEAWHVFLGISAVQNGVSP